LAINKRKVLEAARKYVQKGAQAKALKEFEKLLKLDPRDARLRLEVGDAFRRWGNKAKAIETYTKVATQYTKEGFDARAVAVYKQIHNLDPEAYETYEPLSELYQRMGLTAEAIGALQTAADGFHKLNRKPQALDLLRKMATLDPTNTASRIKVADLLKQEGMVQESIAEYEAASAELQRQGDADAAASVCERILEVEPDRIDTLIRLARNLVDRGLADRAESFAKRILELKPDEPDHYELMAAVYRLQNRDEELSETYRKLADLFRRRGDDDQAREILQRYGSNEVFEGDLGLDEETAFGAMGSEIPLIDSGGSDSDDINASTLGGLGGNDFDELLLETEAPAEIGEAPLNEEKDDESFGIDGENDDLLLEIDPPEAAPPARPPPVGDPDQLLAEASVYLRYGKREQAIENIEAIVAQNSEHRQAFEKLGEAYADGDRPEKAVEAWLRAAEIARAAGDAEGLSVLRDRIAALDEAAAAAIVMLEPEAVAPESSGGPGVESTVIDMDSIDLSETESDASHEIDLDDIEIDLDDSEFEESTPESASDDPGDLDANEAAEPASPVATDPAAESSGIAGASAAMVQQVGEDLEEADFYMKQGLADEAEAIYQRVLSIAPNHPHALVRLGEVAAMRGEDPTASPVTSPNADSLTGDAAASDPAIEADHSSSFSDDIEGPDLLALDADSGAGDSSSFHAEVTEPDGVAAFDDAPISSGEASSESSDLLDDTASDESLELAEDGEPLLPMDGDASGEASEATPIDGAGGDVELDDATEGELAPPWHEDGSIASPDDTAGSSTPDLGEPPDLVVEADADMGAAGFDLAAELNDVFDDDGHSGTMSGLGDSDDGFEAVFSAFKKGVSETLAEGDHEAHFDLGIAYREMGLYDDAKSEFRAAMKNPGSEIECRHMIGLCCFETGQYEEAVAEFQRIVATDAATEEQKLTARLELGRSWQQLGEIDRARTAFESVAAVNPSFCEVSELLIALDACEKPDADVPNLEELESFDDLLSDDVEAADDDVSDPPTAEYESFDGFLEDETDYGDDPEREPAAGAEAEIVAEPEPEPVVDIAPEPRKKKRRKISFV